MTLAPRVEIYTQLSCNKLRGGNWNHTRSAASLLAHPYSTLLTAVDPIVPHIYPSTFFPPPNEIDFSYNSTSVFFPAPAESQRNHGRDQKRAPSSRCASDPAVQAGAAQLQTIMTVTMGFLSALTSGWWGAFGERHGRTKVLAISTLGLLLT